MVSVIERSPSNMLKDFCVHLDGEITENYNASKMTFDNARGKGYVSLYEISRGFTAWVYNVNVVSDLIINVQFSDDEPYNFNYNLKGFQLQKFPSERNHSRIEQNQNFIIIGKPNTLSEFIIPKNISYQCCYLIINPVLINQINIPSKVKLLEDFEQLFDHSELIRPYRYFGAIDAKMSVYADLIINNSRTDVVGRLIIEGAILNLLAAQLEAYSKDSFDSRFTSKLSSEELSKIASLGDFILTNLSEKLTVKSIANSFNISESKLQRSVKYLYGYSVNDYATKIKIERARQLLNETNLSISEVCYRVGYQSRSYFTKLFAFHYGESPSDYRRSFVRNDALFEISYRSLSLEMLTARELDTIVSKAKIENKQHNITGCLIYHDKVFFQIIEGPKSEILQLYENIVSDKRHSEIKLMWKGYKKNREFEGWSMAAIADIGSQEITVQGMSSELQLAHLLGKMNPNLFLSGNLWKKVRSLLKLINHKAA